MKTILSSHTMDIPEEVTVKVKAKIVEVEGPRGKLTRNFKHLNLDFELVEGGKKLKVDAWFGSRKSTAAIRTALSHVQNLITGVTKGYRYKMRFVYAHFPINASITNSNSSIEIRNFLGEKKVRSYPYVFYLGVLYDIVYCFRKFMRSVICYLLIWYMIVTFDCQHLNPSMLDFSC
ncbi:60S ribosomal protein L9 [Dendrobium catenatum]|uniref:60S ribosomal protein L9 n=1 Tax=Dendrobium catenatum TaxID=906689 RepID=A0A2I0X8C5_9ASPA|nr:60S ribosomal protein L9 [Dendrobium catenatum]